MPRKRFASKLYLKFQITFLEYLKILLHRDWADVTRYDCIAWRVSSFAAVVYVFDAIEG